MKISTIGFTQKSAERFFTILKNSGSKRVVDVRLNNVSQLAGFAKRDDLRYFLKNLHGMDYVHVSELAPKKEMLKAYQDKKMTWLEYEGEFLNLMCQRRIERVVDRSIIDDGCLLCSEDKPHHCHRRLVAEYLRKQWCDVDIEIKHLV